MCDSGSQVNLIKHNVIDPSIYRTTPTNLNLVGVTENSMRIKNKITACIQPWFHDEPTPVITTEFLLLPKSSGWAPTYPPQDILCTNILEPLNAPLADPFFWKSAPLPLLIGIEVYAAVLEGTARKVSTCLIEQKTIMGNVIMGRVDDVTNTSQSAQSNEKRSVYTIDIRDIDEKMQMFWDFEDIKLCTKKDVEHDIIEKMFYESHHRDADGRHIVRIPLKPQIKELGSSRASALKRFFMIEKKGQRDPEYWKQYLDFMKEYEELGHMVEVNTDPSPGSMVYHIPHHGIKQGARFRVVFDGSCMTDKGISLNTAQFIGPKLQRDIHEVLMRFRRHKYAISADITKMYRQIGIAQDQWNLQRIFFRAQPHLPLKEYCLKVVTYGLSSSPYLSVKSMIIGAEELATDYPDAVHAIKNDFYMDDCTTGANSEQSAIQLAKEIEYVLQKSCLPLRKWKSNSKKLVREMAGENEAGVLFDEEGKTSVLGIKWLPQSDEITIEVRAQTIDTLTKRTMLSHIYRLYDPNGLVAPVITKAKLLMQTLWKNKLEWDQPVSTEIESQWESLWSTIHHLSAIRIPRWFGMSDCTKMQLHGFADSSGKAYGCAIYLRVEHEDQTIEVHLIAAKSKVAPIKPVSIPRLELAAAHLLSQLFTSVTRALEMEHITYHLWTDNIAAIQWIKKDLHDLKLFVANRVKFIQSSTNVNSWNHVRSEHNPADLISRGIAPKNIVNNKLWWNGPSWLKLPQEQWPMPVNVERFQPSNEMIKEVKIHFTQIQKTLDIFVPNKGAIPLIDYTNTCAKVCRILTYVMRFINLCKIRKKHTRNNTINEITNQVQRPTIEEKREAMKMLIRIHQKTSYTREHAFFIEQGKSIDYKQFPENSRIISLHPFMDDEGIIRVGNRAKSANLPYDTKHPIIIENDTRLCQLIITEAHAATGHGGVQIMTQYIRRNYWIFRIRNQLRSHVHKCTTCAKWEKKKCEQLMCDLPADRVNQNRAFLITGVDYAGPIDVVEKYKSVSSKRKAWIAIFVCMVTRAVHIELVSDQSSIAFIMAFERFVARRGHCNKLYSDNAMYFKGAYKEIKAAFKEWHKPSVQDHINKKGTEWVFLKESAPHQGGIYEAAVKSTKFHLHRLLGNVHYTFEHLTTILTKVEAILNSRPLYPLSDDPTDLSAITPGHFLINEPLIMPPAIASPQKTQNPIKRIRDEQQKLLQSFWKAWRNEYLATLMQRKKWVHEKEPLKIGQMVIIDENDLIPTDWTMGKIIQLIPSKDGIIRAVKVRTSKNVLIRPIQKLCILPIAPALDVDKPEHNIKADKSKYSKKTIKETLEQIQST